jgi:hypothetical protein
MEGQFPRSLEETLVDKEHDIKWELESAVLAAQDQALSADCFKKKFW